MFLEFFKVADLQHEGVHFQRLTQVVLGNSIVLLVAIISYIINLCNLVII